MLIYRVSVCEAGMLQDAECSFSVYCGDEYSIFCIEV